jgi:hypothetical protein
MAFGSVVGLTGTYADPDTGRSFVALHPGAALLSFFLLLFALAHWPHRQPTAGVAARGAEPVGVA